MELRSFRCPECGEKLEYQQLLEDKPDRLTYSSSCQQGHQWGITIKKPEGYVVLREPIEETSGSWSTRAPWWFRPPSTDERRQAWHR